MYILKVKLFNFLCLLLVWWKCILVNTIDCSELEACAWSQRQPRYTIFSWFLTLRRRVFFLSYCVYSRYDQSLVFFESFGHNFS